MHYRKINHSGFPFLAENIFAIYELSASGKESYYKTIPSGLIGLTLLLDGKAWYRSEDQWMQVPRFSTYGLIKKPSLIKTSSHCRDLSIGFKPFLLSQFLKHNFEEASKSSVSLFLLSTHLISMCLCGLFPTSF